MINLFTIFLCLLCTKFIISSPSSSDSTVPAKVDQVDEEIIAELDPHYYSSEDDLYKLDFDIEKSGDSRRFYYVK